MNAPIFASEQLLDERGVETPEDDRRRLASTPKNSRSTWRRWTRRTSASSIRSLAGARSAPCCSSPPSRPSDARPGVAAACRRGSRGGDSVPAPGLRVVIHRVGRERPGADRLHGRRRAGPVPVPFPPPTPAPLYLLSARLRRDRVSSRPRSTATRRCRIPASAWWSTDTSSTAPSALAARYRGHPRAGRQTAPAPGARSHRAATTRGWLTRVAGRFRRALLVSALPGGRGGLQAGRERLLARRGRSAAAACWSSRPSPPGRSRSCSSTCCRRARSRRRVSQRRYRRGQPPAGGDRRRRGGRNHGAGRYARSIEGRCSPLGRSRVGRAPSLTARRRGRAPPPAAARRPGRRCWVMRSRGWLGLGALGGSPGPAGPFDPHAVDRLTDCGSPRSDARSAGREGGGARAEEWAALSGRAGPAQGGSSSRILRRGAPPRRLGQPQLLYSERRCSEAGATPARPRHCNGQ